MSGINYGGLLFTNPVPIAYALPPKDPGLYVIQVRNPNFGPMPFQPIAFGASDNLAAGRLESHAQYPRWKIHRPANRGLFASYCLPSINRAQSLPISERCGVRSAEPRCRKPLDGGRACPRSSTKSIAKKLHGINATLKGHERPAELSYRRVPGSISSCNCTTAPRNPDRRVKR